MENNSTSIIWNRTAGLLRDELSDVSFKKWIIPIKPVSLERDHVILEVPSNDFIVTLEERYNHMVLDALRSASHDDNITAVYVTPDSPEVNKLHKQRLNASGNANNLLKPRYTFNTFIVGRSNQLARAAAIGAAESPGNLYNPLFLYSGTGLGKTHLMHAIGNYIFENNPSANIMYVTSERFTIDLISSLQTGRNEEFRERYRNVDVLLLDDIQFIADKERTQEEFFHTFNAIYEAGNQIVLTSDKPPKEIPSLEERLRSRFEMGLIADISQPDFETRVAILLKKAEMDGINIEDNNVMSYIASRVESNIRELEGSLTRVVAYAALTGAPITVDLTEEALKDYLSPSRKRAITPVLIQQAVCNHFGLTIDDLCSKRRSRDIARPRQMAMYILRNHTDLSLPKIGEVFGGRDHTTVMHACDKIADEIVKNDSLRDTLDDILKSILE